MPQLFGKAFTRQELLRVASNMAQICGVTESVYQNGKSGGMKHYTVKTGSGLEFELLPDRCLDIASVTFNGVNISFLTKNGIVSPTYANAAANAFSHYMTGGMLMTCGLLNAGDACMDTDGAFHPAHGTIGITPAESPYSKEYWDNDDYIFEAGGKMRESGLFGENLTLSRNISAKLGENSISIHDTVENNGPEAVEFMLLYHFNFGYPFLNEKLKVQFPDGTVTARDSQAKHGILDCERMICPQDGFCEQVFFRDAKSKNGIVTAILENNEIGIGVRLSYQNDNLPILVQWKSMRSGDYALGIEPSNNYIMGRKAERKNGTIKQLKGFGKEQYTLKLEFYTLSSENKFKI